MKISAAISFFVSIITLSIAQPSGHALWRIDSDSSDAEARSNGTVLQRPAGYAALDSKDNFEARQTTISMAPIVLHKRPGKTAAEFYECLLRINRNLEDLQWLLPHTRLQTVIRIAHNDPGCSIIANKHYYEIDLHGNTKIILDETLTDGSGSEGIVAYIPTRIFPQEPTRKYVYPYSIFAKGAASSSSGRLAQPTVTASGELPRIPSPIAAIITAIGVTLLYRIRHRNECPQNPICLKQTPIIKMTKRRH